MKLTETATSEPQLLAGKSFVVSGVFEHHSRNEIKELIERYGGKNVSSISSKTDYVLWVPPKKQKPKASVFLLFRKKSLRG